MDRFARRQALFFTIVIVSFSLFFPACGDLLTGGSGDGGNNWAVIVGISNYRVPSFNLNYADDDALDYYDALVRGSNWEPSRMNVLLNTAATRSAISAKISSVGAQMSSSDKFVFFFSGHGTTGPDQSPADESDGLEEYLVPYDAISNSHANDISDDDLESWLKALPTTKVLVVLDASFSGGFIKGQGRAKGTLKYIDRGTVSSPPAGRIDGIARDLVRTGFIVQTASRANESPLESNILKNGVFTYYMTQGMLGAANSKGSTITAQQAFAYASPRATAFYSGQHPQQSDQRGSDYVLIRK